MVPPAAIAISLSHMTHYTQIYLGFNLSDQLKKIEEIKFHEKKKKAAYMFKKKKNAA